MVEQLTKLKFGGMFGYRWKPTDRLFVLGFDEENRREFSFVGNQFRHLLNEVPTPWFNGSDPVVRTRAFLTMVDAHWAAASSFEYVGSTPTAARYCRHCVLLQSWYLPDAACDQRRTGFQSIDTDLSVLFSKTEQVLVTHMRNIRRDLNRSAVA